jgi:hypothetical protein
VRAPRGLRFAVPETVFMMAKDEGLLEKCSVYAEIYDPWTDAHWFFLRTNPIDSRVDPLYMIAPQLLTVFEVREFLRSARSVGR